MAVGDDDTVAGTLPGGTAASGIADVVAGRYRIVRWLGGGGMGRVYEALDAELGERVALKVLRAGLSEEAIERFRREVRLTRRIQHRNVARMFDIGDHQGDKFLTMELVQGEPLTRELGTRMAWPRLQRLAVQICEGLAAAHGAGVIHRDLKPDNVLVERGTDRAVITDFGIARSGDDASVTQVGVVIGTPRYMAPEQLAGTPDIDARADVFSLGVMLYELASGTRPWAGDNPIAIAVVQATHAPRPLAAPHVPGEFAELVMGCLAIDRALRPAGATELAVTIAALDSTMHGRPSRPTLAPLAQVGGSPTPSPVGFPVEDVTSIAVLPFACAPGDEHLGEGVQEDLTDTLATGQLRVRPPGPSSIGCDPREAGRALEVDHVVAGSVRRTGTGLRVSARLISVADGFQIWAHRAECTEAALLGVAAELGRGIADALSTRASSGVQPTDPRAVELYLRARAELRRFWGEHAITAAGLLEEAVAYAPNYPPLVCALALAATQAWTKTTEVALLPRAEATVARALATGHGEAYLASAILRMNQADPEGGAADLGVALARAPMSAPAHEIAARVLLEVGEIDEARHHFATAIGLDAGRAQLISLDLARLDGLAGDWDAAERRIAALLADADPAIVMIGNLARARFACWRDDHATALAAVAHVAPAVAAARTNTIVAIASTYTQDGPFDQDGWDELIGQLLTGHRPRRMELLGLQRAVEVGMLVRQPGAALGALRHAVERGLFDIVWFDECPILAELRTDPRSRPLRDQLAARAGRVLAAFRAAR